jgi:hypothetical protein
MRFGFICIVIFRELGASRCSRNSARYISKGVLYIRARIFKLLKTPSIDSTESIPFENQFRSGIDSQEGVKKRPPENDAIKIYILWDMANTNPDLVPSQFPESIFTPITRPKIPAQCTNQDSLD